MTALRAFDLRTAPLDGGTTLLEASAGTGKTYTLVGLLLRLLLEGKIDKLEQALVVTFTIAATEELKTRLRAGLERVLRVVEGGSDDEFFTALARRDGAEARLRAALDDFDRAPIATIHGFCKRLLDESAFESRQPFQLDFLTDPLPLLHRVAADVLRCRYEAAAGALSAVLHHTKLTPDTLVKLYRLWRRYPDVSFEPDPADAAPFLAAMPGLANAAAGLFDDDCAVCLVNLEWKKGESLFVGPPEHHVERLRRLLQEDPQRALPQLICLSPRELKDRLFRRCKPIPHPFFTTLDELAAAANAATEHLRAELLREMDRRLLQEKQREHVLSFDDLLQRTHDALRDPARRPVLLAALRERYTVALIDEFQDTDSLQYEIFAQCFDQRPLFLIGDPKQAIYGFRGADLQTYLAASDDASDRRTLGTNYRSAPELVHAVSHLFGQPRAFVQAGIEMPAARANAAPGTLRLLGDDLGAFCWRLLPPTGTTLLAKPDAEDRIARDVAAEISRLLAEHVRLDGRRLRPRDIAVLTRTNRQAVRIQDELRAAGIASAIGKAGDIFDTEELTELERVLRAILQPGDLHRARAAMSTRLWGKDAAWLSASHADDMAFDRELQRLMSWRRLWIRSGFVVMAEQLLDELGAVARLLTRRGGERSLTNFLQLFELLHQAEHGRRLSPEGLLEWLQHERRHKEEIDYQLRELRLESDEDAAQILTVHGSKGLEYEVVFCPFLWDSRRSRGEDIVPGPDGRRLSFGLAGEDKDAAEVNRIAEDLRLCYVALTRARRRCYVHVGHLGSNFGGTFSSALAWLLLPRPADLDLEANPTAFGSWTQAAKKALPDLRDHLAKLAAPAGMSVVEVGEEPQPLPVAPATPPTLQPPLPPPRPVQARALHSFSSLIAGSHAIDPTPDVADPPTREEATETESMPEGIFAFARGARAGLCLHALLERADLEALPESATTQLVRDTLVEYGLLEPTAHQGPIDPVADVLANLRDLAAARVHDDGPTLRELWRGPRAVEWKFTVPTPGSDLRALAAAFAAHGSPLARRYAVRLRNLQQRHLRGYLTGFVDLLTTHDGRHWVLDWKSNHLGNRRSDYGEEQLAAAMVDSDYVLQYHLYVLALHRQLHARLPDYDYERHMGGVCYAFLRGVAPGATSGMLHDRVPLRLIEEMDRWAGGRK
ncbi:MAG: exodeoxyribonuclease V subunit beta [Planctomycetes bacterium]|nr:exodeoxyribonuclease V subunit beta [Planctomycetota bacterium]